jgi:hypothetical protein
VVLTISSYVDPGIYVGEVIVPSGVNIATTPVQIGIVGVGSREKRVNNEAVQRGLVEAEALTLVNQTRTGTSISFSISGSTVTLTDTLATFPTSIIGQPATVAGATSAANNGTFTIIDRPSTTSFTYTNAAGVTEAGIAGTSYAIQPHVTLANRSDRKLDNTTAYKNGVVINDDFLAYQSAFVQGTVTANRTSITGSAFNTLTFSLDGKIPITMRITATGAATVVTPIGGTQFNVVLLTAAQPALSPITVAEIAAGINAVLNAATTQGYGADYASAARVASGIGLRITSPITGPTSDVQIYPSIETDINGDANSRLFTATTVKAASVLGVSRLQYSSTATYTADYVNIDSNSDTLNNTGIQSIIKVGTFIGVGNFIENTDFTFASNAITWGGSGVAPDEPARYPATAVTGTVFDPSTISNAANDTLRLSFDGRAAIDVDLVQAGSLIAGFNSTGFANDFTSVQEVAANINAVLANSSTYGIAYGAVATAVASGATGYIRLTSPTEGTGSSITISQGSTNSATSIVFGTASSITVTGTGARPTLGSIYFATYSMTRSTATGVEYNVQKRFFTLDTLKADLGPTSSSNSLVLAAELAFANGAPSVVVVQVNDATSTGAPTRAEWQAALTATTQNDVITDLVLLTTDLSVQTDLKDHIERQSSPTEKHYRRGWFGMARSTAVGDKDTADTYVYRARRTLQVASDSPGRGRYILVAPPQLTGLSRDIVLEDGSTQTVNLDSTYLAVAIAAKKSSFTSPASSLARKTVTGFNLTDVTNPWLPVERGLMASAGVMVLTYDAGIFKILDPVTTEAGGGGLTAFKYESTSSQKDNVSRKIDQALDANVIGVVPTNLADFLIDIKLIIASVLNGEIGSGAIAPFKNADGTNRALNLTRDIEVQQDANDPTKFYFKYFFLLRYPALRLFGEFSVDRSFFDT